MGLGDLKGATCGICGWTSGKLATAGAAHDALKAHAASAHPSDGVVGHVDSHPSYEPDDDDDGRGYDR